ncbi:hypothetical protein RRG08_037259 [Elysia crispata]|uniref:Uncharacterized protein n=1 Tax=Elysia crispata TaxID=231223 RepID=A0AAE1CP15_9GAST|nr:hypothetical protein RRG08_037259 [Elysia crispata]
MEGKQVQVCTLLITSTFGLGNWRFHSPPLITRGTLPSYRLVSSLSAVVWNVDLSIHHCSKDFRQKVNCGGGKIVLLTFCNYAMPQRFPRETDQQVSCLRTDS